MEISVIIPVHNSIEYTRESLQHLMVSIIQVSHPEWHFSVVVVDDGSSDGTSGWIRQHYPKVHLCSGDGNLWWSGAMNMGMEFALKQIRSDYIIWWNNDIYPAEDYFQNLIRVLGSYETNVLIGSKIYIAEKPDVIWSYGGDFHKFWGHSYMPGSNQKDGASFLSPREADWLAGMGTVLHRNIIQKTGLLNSTDFPHYHGDVDYCCRARIAGFKIVVVPELRIWNYTQHSGRTHGFKWRNLIPNLIDIKSINHFHKEWKLYRKYAHTPLAYLMLLKKYAGYFVKFVLRSGERGEWRREKGEGRRERGDGREKDREIER